MHQMTRLIGGSQSAVWPSALEDQIPKNYENRKNRINVFQSCVIFVHAVGAFNQLNSEGISMTIWLGGRERHLNKKGGGGGGSCTYYNLR